jgi:histidinol dehydrogenase
MRVLTEAEFTAWSRQSGTRRAARILREAEAIVADIRRRGDVALRSWTRRLDGHAGPRRLTERELRDGWDATPAHVRSAIRVSARLLARVAKRELPVSSVVEAARGVRIERRVAPLARVGCYVPAGRFPLPSTVVMTVVPARVAGVTQIAVACPHPGPAVLCAALEAGATEVYRMGGAQAIAALAYGTRTVPRVDKIVGPGNAWVAAAKAAVTRDCAIDFVAGPSEIVVLADTLRPEWVAADLLAQAEHDPLARAVLITTRPAYARAVAGAIRQIGRPSANVVLAVVPSRARAVALINRASPEHAVCERKDDARALTTAGTVFVGRWSAQAAGDYCTGSNHVLPTNGHARFRGGLSAADFVRVSTVQTLTAAGLRRIGLSAIRLARAEGLHAHAESIAIRLGPAPGRPRTRGGRA